VCVAQLHPQCSAIRLLLKQGEVEEIISEDASPLEKSQSKTRIRKFVDRIIPNDEEGETFSCSKGKLEHYLERNSPDHYSACLSAGVIIN